MRVFLFVLAVLALLYSFAVQVAAKSAIHEILAGISLVVSAILFVGSALLERLDVIKKMLQSR
jgi:asparagine N-glycosylation enzyme membrane subunit Stt3